MPRTVRGAPLFNVIGSVSLGIGLLALVGCTATTPKAPITNRRPIASPDSLQLVKDLARPWGTKWIEVEGVTLATNLHRTGSDPAPSTERNMLLKEMQVREVHQPDSILASPNTALVMVRALVPPAARKGDRVDLEVRVPARSTTTSLEGGWAMLTRMREFALLNGRLSHGDVLALGQGDIVTEGMLEGSDDAIMKTRGRILGGGIVSVPRELGLRVRDEHMSVRTSSKIGEAINRRFHVYQDGDKQGVATPRRDSFISLAVHPRYFDNLTRYVRVIQNIPVRESQQALSSRLQALEARLQQPDLASETAVQLEAIGVDALPVLKTGLRSTNQEVRFHSAEALAYLDEPSCAAELADAIRLEPAFRWRAFRALGAMDQIESQEELAMLVHEESAETRYGAFRTLRRISPDDPLVRGEPLGSTLRLHHVASAAQPMVHIAKMGAPEIVLYGESFPLLPPVVLFVGNDIVIKDTADGRLRIRRLTPGANDERRVVEATLPDAIEALVDLDASYAEVVQAIVKAQANGSLECKVAFSAIPEPGRKYRRDWNTDQAAQESIPEVIEAGDDLADTNSEETLAPVVSSMDSQLESELSDEDFEGLLLFED